MDEIIENLKLLTIQRREREVQQVVDMLIEAKNEADMLDRQKGVVMDEAFEHIARFAVDRMIKKDVDSLSKLYRSMPPEFRVWLDKTRDIFELITGSKLEEDENA